MQVLLSKAEIQQRVRELGAEISQTYAGEPLTVVAILTGSVILVADLMRELSIPHEVAFVRASSYRGATTSAQALVTDLMGLPDLSHRHVLLVDDIFDTGRTLERISKEVQLLSPTSLRTLVLLWKTARRDVDLKPDYFGFQIPDEFVVGYGLDFNGQYRHLPEICVLDEKSAPDLTASVGSE